MAITIKLRSIRHSARKLQPVVRFVAGKKLNEAINSTSVMSQDSAFQVHKALKMAEAAAKQKEFNTDELIVAQIFATIGPKIRRMRPNARGRGNSYQKYLAHLTVILDTPKPTKVVERPKRAKKTADTKMKEEK